MARAYASRIIGAPVEAVWAELRDFNAMPRWNPAIKTSEIEDGLRPDAVGAVRRFMLPDGTIVRERLLSLDDSLYRFSYNFETPAFPVENYRAEMELIPVTNGEATFAQWSATFDEAPEDRDRYVDIIATQVFAAGLKSLDAAVRGRAMPPDTTRWQGRRPAKVFCSSVLDASLDAVWSEMRDFAGMDGWHPEIRDMSMLGGVRSDTVGGVRDFLFGEGQLHEQLTALDDSERSFQYRILVSPNPWLNYHSGARLYSVTSSGKTFAVWTADWTAAPEDDVELIPMVHRDVFQLALDTLNAKLLKA